MSIELKKANEYEKAEQEKIPVEEKPAFHVAAQWDGSMIQMDFPGIRDRFIFLSISSVYN